LLAEEFAEYGDGMPLEPPDVKAVRRTRHAGHV